MSHSSLPFLRKLLASSHPVLVPLSGRARGEVIGFRPMAVLCDEEQAFKPAAPVGKAAPALPGAALAAAAPTTRPVAAASGQFRFFHAFSATARTPAPDASARSRSSSRLVLSGTFSEVCGELERLVVQEERYLHAG